MQGMISVEYLVLVLEEGGEECRVYDMLQSGKTRYPVMEIQAGMSHEVQNFVGNSFGYDAGIDQFNEKGQSREGILFQGKTEGGWGGGLLMKKREGLSL